MTLGHTDAFPMTRWLFLQANCLLRNGPGDGPVMRLADSIFVTGCCRLDPSRRHCRYLCRTGFSALRADPVERFRTMNRNTGIGLDPEADMGASNVKYSDLEHALRCAADHDRFQVLSRQYQHCNPPFAQPCLICSGISDEPWGFVDAALYADTTQQQTTMALARSSTIRIGASLMERPGADRVSARPCRKNSR